MTQDAAVQKKENGKSTWTNRVGKGFAITVGGSLLHVTVSAVLPDRELHCVASVSHYKTNQKGERVVLYPAGMSIIIRIDAIDFFVEEKVEEKSS
jgi:hypothetical protein